MIIACLLRTVLPRPVILLSGVVDLVPDRVESIIAPDPDRGRNPGHADLDPADPDRYQFQANEKVEKLKFFPRKFQYSVKNT